MSWLKSLTSKRAPPPAAVAAIVPQHQPQPADADDFLSDALLPVEQVSPPPPTHPQLHPCYVDFCDGLMPQDRKRSKAALAAEAAAAARVPLVVRMQESVTSGMTRALDSSNKVMGGPLARIER